jgi:hypothetical protein
MSERVLVFPEDVQVGWVYVHRQGSAQPGVPARGNVHIPAGSAAELFACTPVRGLGCLQPDDLHWLALQKKSATDTDLARIAHLTGLRDLYCSKSHAVTDAGLAHLRGLTRLRALDLYSSAVSDAGLIHLAGMVDLRHLHLGATRVKGSGLRLLSGLQRLEWLSLEDTDVDDGVIPHLAALRALRKLALWGTRLSTRGVATLKAELPGVEIVSRDTGRRLARERARDGILRILAGRLDAPTGAAPAEALARLLPAGSTIEWCYGGVSRPLWTHDDGLDALSLGLRHGIDFDLRVLRPGAPERRVPWLRRRRHGRRAGEARSEAQRHA